VSASQHQAILRNVWYADTRTLILFLSDRGESLGEDGEDEHAFFLYSAPPRVSLTIKVASEISPTAPAPVP
jgi:hypothetical protein